MAESGVVSNTSLLSVHNIEVKLSYRTKGPAGYCEGRLKAIASQIKRGMPLPYFE